MDTAAANTPGTNEAIHSNMNTGGEIVSALDGANITHDKEGELGLEEEEEEEDYEDDDEDEGIEDDEHKDEDEMQQGIKEEPPLPDPVSDPGAAGQVPRPRPVRHSSKEDKQIAAALQLLAEQNEKLTNMLQQLRQENLDLKTQQTTLLASLLGLQQELANKENPTSKTVPEHGGPQQEK